MGLSKTAFCKCNLSVNLSTVSKYTTLVDGGVPSSYDGLISTSQFKEGCSCAHEASSGAAHHDDQ